MEFHQFTQKLNTSHQIYDTASKDFIYINWATVT